jgi:MoaA/NifB/PqqE/SkfB family radical SAM enzyme
MKCLSIHLTDRCNSACEFCVVGSPLRSEDSVRYEDVLAFLEEHQGQGFEVVNLHGGEPTIHPRFLETLDTIAELGYPEVHVQTNGIRLADSRFVRQLAERRVTKVIISLHGDVAEIHEGHTLTRGSFCRATKAIEYAKSSGLHVRTNSVITRHNMARLPGIASLACDLGVDHVNFSNLHPVGSARLSRDRIMPRLSEVRPHLREAAGVALRRSRRVTLEGFPYCTLDGGLEELHLGNEYRAIKLLIGNHVLQDYDLFMKERMRTLGDACRGCCASDQCGGVYPEYVESYGWGEFSPSAVPPLFGSEPVLA